MITIPETGVHESSISFIWQAENGIVYLVYKPNAVNLLPEAQEHLQIFSKIAGCKKVPVLVDMGNIQSTDREARQFAAGPEYAAIMKAVAVVVPSMIGRILANIFININRPPYPTRLFNDEASALEWLAQFQEDTPAQCS